MYITGIFLKTPLSIYFNFFPNFFPKFEFPNLGCGLSASAAYTPEFMVIECKMLNKKSTVDFSVGTKIWTSCSS